MAKYFCEDRKLESHDRSICAYCLGMENESLKAQLATERGKGIKWCLEKVQIAALAFVGGVIPHQLLEGEFEAEIKSPTPPQDADAVRAECACDPWENNDLCKNCRDRLDQLRKGGKNS